MKNTTLAVKEIMETMGYDVETGEHMHSGINHEFITINNGTNIRPSFNIDEMMNFSDDPKEIAEYIDWLYNHEVQLPELNIDLNDYNTVKHHLKPVLVPKRFLKDGYINLPAEKFGFEDLYIMLQLTNILENHKCLTYVSENLFREWDTPLEVVILDACDNVFEKAAVIPLAEKIEEMTGITAANFDSPLYIASYTDNASYGAICAILLKAELEDLFPNGYIVIPSSIHEVLILPIENNTSEINSIIEETNAYAVNDKDILSDHFYIMK